MKWSLKHIVRMEQGLEDLISSEPDSKELEPLHQRVTLMARNVRANDFKIPYKYCKELDKIDAKVMEYIFRSDQDILNEPWDCPYMERSIQREWEEL